MNEFKRILVVVSMIQSCQKAIQSGVSLAQHYNAKLFVLHSLHNPFGLQGWSVGTLSLAEEYQRIVQETRQQLSKLVEAERVKGVSITVLLKEGEPTEEILKTITAERIDLLVMLAHEEGRLEHLLFGRLNDELVRRLPCSLLLVKKEPTALVEENEESFP